jgi:hypothetical protein
MSRPQIVNLILEEIAEDSLHVEKYIEALEQERDQLKNENESLWETLFQVAEMLNVDYDDARKQGGKPSAVYRKYFAEHDAQVIDQFKDELVKSVSVVLKPHIEGVCEVIKIRLRQKAQEAE